MHSPTVGIVNVTEVRIKLESSQDGNERLDAFATITLDNGFVIRDLKLIKGSNGYFVAMPSRKVMDRCYNCGSKNHLRARFCNSCGRRLNENRVGRDDGGRAKLYADVAHPINQACREVIQNAVIAAFQREVEASKQPGYVPRYDDFLPEDPNGNR